MAESQVRLKRAFCGKPISPKTPRRPNTGRPFIGCYFAKIEEGKSQRH
jgi:hypothetical protein